MCLCLVWRFRLRQTSQVWRRGSLVIHTPHVQCSSFHSEILADRYSADGLWWRRLMELFVARQCMWVLGWIQSPASVWPLFWAGRLVTLKHTIGALERGFCPCQCNQYSWKFPIWICFFSPTVCLCPRAVRGLWVCLSTEIRFHVCRYLEYSLPLFFCLQSSVDILVFICWITSGSTYWQRTEVFQ